MGEEHKESKGFLSFTLKTQKAQRKITGKNGQQNSTQDRHTEKSKEESGTKSQFGLSRLQLYLQFGSKVEEKKEQNKENNSWKNAMRITMLGLILLCATQCSMEVTPEVMSYLVIGIQTAMRINMIGTPSFICFITP